MKSAITIFILLLFSITISIIISCDKEDEGADDDDVGDDDDTDGNDDDDSSSDNDNPECDSNVYPVLISVALIVNGVETQMPTTVQATDALAIAFEYSDEDCNLDDVGSDYGEGYGGRVDIRWNTLEDLPIEVHAYWLSNDIDCSSEEKGAPYFLEIDPNDYIPANGYVRQYPLRMTLFDNCGSGSNRLEIDFTVEE